jgi:hypothetical protein
VLKIKGGALAISPTIVLSIYYWSDVAEFLSGLLSAPNLAVMLADTDAPAVLAASCRGTSGVA